MCGINGIFSKINVDSIEKRIKSMNNSIIHRGPDSGDHFIHNNIALGHRRLSIIDTNIDRINQCTLILKCGISFLMVKYIILRKLRKN